MADTLTREAIAYGSQPLSPVPQYWDGASYAKVQGINGATRIINYNSAGETFTGASPGSVQLTATSTVAISGTSTINFSGTATVQVVTSAGGSAYFTNSNPATMGIVSSAGDSLLFSATNPGHVEIISSAGNTFTSTSPGLVTVLSASSGGTSVFSNASPAFVSLLSTTNNPNVYTATITWSSGTTATSSQTLTVGTITASITATSVELVVTNGGSPYAITVNIYKNISSSFTTSAISTLTSPAEIISAGVTINAVRGAFSGLFNFNQGLTLRFTTTATFTATVTNNVIIKELS